MLRKPSLRPVTARRMPERFNAFVEVNAKEQVYNLAKTSIVQGAWKNGQDLMLHGWVYGLNSGFVTDLNVNIASNAELDEVYQLSNL